MTKISNQYSLTNILTADLANSRLGINNVSPAYSLDLTGTARVSTSAYFATASGSVGIGTTSPTSLSQFQKFLHIDGGASNNSALCLSGQGLAGQGTIGYDTNILYIDAVGSATGANNTITFNTTSVNSSNLRLERMRVTAAGNVGIGSTTAGAQLTLAQNNANTSAQTYLTFRNTATGYGSWAIWKSGGNDLAFYYGVDTDTPSAGYNMKLQYNGITEFRTKIVVNTASTSGLPIGLQLNNPFGFGTINTGTQIAWSQADQQQGAIIVGQQDINTSAFSWMAFYTNNAGNVTQAMKISSNGSIGAPSGTNIYNASDIRLKKNIITTTYGLNSILELNPVKFNWVDGFEKSEDGKDMLGFIAQEMQNVIPEAVESFGNSVSLNLTKINNPLRVNEKFIIPVLVKAIQELSAENTSLINRIEALENK
jgi:hypothetical protein